MRLVRERVSSLIWELVLCPVFAVVRDVETYQARTQVHFSISPGIQNRFGSCHNSDAQMKRHGQAH